MVDVSLRSDAGKPVEVSVVDKGPGIPRRTCAASDRALLQSERRRQSLEKGTGLGLAIVKHILTRHRARLIIRSELDVGTDFTVRF